MTKRTIAQLLKEPWSFSRGDLYARCPREFKLRYLDGIEGGTGYYAKQGKALHEAGRVINERIKNGADQFGVDDIPKMFAAAVEEHFEPGEIKLSDHAACLGWLEFYARRTFSRAENIFAVEKDFQIEYEAGKYFRGKIDLINLIGDDTAEITDLKSGFAIVKHDKLIDNVQLNGYGFSLVKMLPYIRTVILTHWNFRRNSANSVTVDAKHFQSTLPWLRRIVAGVKAGNFPARINNYCCYCVGRDKCKEFGEITSVATGKPNDPEKAHEELLRLKAATPLIKKRKEEVEEYLKALCEGGINWVPVGKEGLGYSLKEKIKRPIDVAAAAAVLANYDIDLLQSGKLSLAKTEFYAIRNAGFEGKTEPEIKIMKEQCAEVFLEKKSTGLVYEKQEAEEEKDGHP